MKAPVVVLIFSHKEDLSWSEQISFAQCFRVLGQHPIRLVCPTGLRVEKYQAIAPGVEIDYLPARWFVSHLRYNRLKVLPLLYRKYSAFEFILTYELDAFVFKDELLQWCKEGWDYVGAPWFEGYYTAKPDAKPFAVGNSGFSLRRTSSMLRVLRSWRYIVPPAAVFKDWRTTGRFTPRSLLGLVSRLTFRNNFFGAFNNYEGNEDLFWCLSAAKQFPWFRLAPYNVAKHFSFETHPGRLFEECGGQLPFGCHRWMAETLGFWRDKIAALGYEIPQNETRVPRHR